jgi:hypothetical protein
MWYTILPDGKGGWVLYNLVKTMLGVRINDEAMPPHKHHMPLPIGAKITTPKIPGSPMFYFKRDEIYAEKMKAMDEETARKRRKAMKAPASP